MDRRLLLSTTGAAAVGLMGLLWLGPYAVLLVVPLATVAAAPLLPRKGCPTCRTPRDPALSFCPGCAR